MGWLDERERTIFINHDKYLESELDYVETERWTPPEPTFRLISVEPLTVDR
ncbi:unnamed protein product [Acidithrix sp. C25]|nr:unnamed protein product [Acidithrix sp. C25]